MKKIIILLVIFFIVIPLQADDKKADAFPQVQVGEEHKMLANGVGEWKIDQKMWMEPGKDPMTATGTCITKSILDGRASVIHVETKSANGTFKGFGVCTWNSVDKKYEIAWVDVYSYYGLDNMVGTYDSKTKTLTWTSTMKDPMSGMEMPVTMVETYPNADTMIAEFFVEVNGMKIKTMQNTYTRIKKTKAVEKAAEKTEPAKAPAKKE